MPIGITLGRKDLRMYVPPVAVDIICCFAGFQQKGRLVGGAVRDFLLKRKIKDYDICIEVGTDYRGSYKDRLEVQNRAKRFGYTVSDATTESNYEGDTIAAVLCLTKKGEHPVDVILLSVSVDQYIDNFTVSISKVSFCVLDNLFYARKDFLKTDKTHEVQIYGEDTEAVEAYVNRIKEKYSEYTFIRFGDGEPQEVQKKG